MTRKNNQKRRERKKLAKQAAAKLNINWDTHNLDGHVWVVLDGKICDPSSQTKAFEMIRKTHGSTRYVEASRATTDAWLICLKKQYEDDPNHEVRWGQCYLNARTFQLVHGGRLAFGSLCFGRKWWEYGDLTFKTPEDFLAKRKPTVFDKHMKDVFKRGGVAIDSQLIKEMMEMMMS